MNKPLDLILRRADVQDHVISYDETSRWPAAEREQIFNLGFLRRMEDCEWVACDACHDLHLEEVFFLPDAAAKNRQLFIYCPEVGTVPVLPERLHRWEVDFGKLAHLLAGAVGADGAVREVTAGRIWLLGKKHVADRLVEFFLVTGIAWEDSGEILRTAPRLQNSPAPIILCPNRLPEAPEWQENGRALFSLRELLRVENSQFVIRSEDFEDLHRQIAAKLEQPITPTPVEKRAALIEEFRRSKKCQIKDICRWADVYRQDLSRWKLGKSHLIPDHSSKGERIEKLLQFGRKIRP